MQNMQGYTATQAGQQALSQAYAGPISVPLIEQIGDRIGNLQNAAERLTRFADKMCGETPNVTGGPRPVPNGMVAGIQDALASLEAQLNSVVSRLVEIA